MMRMLALSCGLTVMCFLGGLYADEKDAETPMPGQKAEGKIAVVPRPAKLDVTGGVFKLTTDTRILAQAGSKDILAVGQYLADQLAPTTDWKLKVEEFAGMEPPAGSILLTSDGAKPSSNVDKVFGDSSHELIVTPKGIVVRGAESRGIFYGVQTIRQLLPPEIEWRQPLSDEDLARIYRLPPEGDKQRKELLAAFRQAEPPKRPERKSWEIPCVRIEDNTRFRWRGLMLDTGRCFHTVEQVKRHIDQLAFHKMNVLHLHLSDEPGWRMEIKKYPKFTDVGAWPDSKKEAWRGGYYTQDDMRELVAYAARRYVMIVPEIEIPSHAHTMAMKRCYPEILECGGPGKGLCMGNEETLQLIEGVITEMVELFPSPFFHLGGDEGNWSLCEKHAEKFGGKPDESVPWKRLKTFLAGKNRRMMTWGAEQHPDVWQYWNYNIPGRNDLLRGDLSKFGKGRMDIVMSPINHCYVNMPPKPLEKESGNRRTIKEYYELDPINPDWQASPELAARVLGGEDCQWCDYLWTPTVSEPRIFPRICATAEALWSPLERKDFADFMKRMNTHTDRLRWMGVRLGPSGMEDRMNP